MNNPDRILLYGLQPQYRREMAKEIILKLEKQQL